MKWYTKQDIMRVINVSAPTVQKWWDSGLKREKRVGANNRIKYHTSHRDLENFLGREITADEQNRV